METPLEALNAQIFAAQLHTKFHTRASAAPLELELCEVEERENSPKIELFILRFHGPPTPRLSQKIYLLEHEKLGTFGIFLTAIGADESGIVYESVFHRLRKKTVPGA